MNSNIDSIIKAEKDDWGNAVQTFVTGSLEVFAFPELNEGLKRKNVWAAIYNIAKHSDDPNIIKNCFIAVRILSREKDHLVEMVDDAWIELIKYHSGLSDMFEYNASQISICIEVLKSMSNILFNCRQLAAKAVDNGILQGLTNRIRHFSEKNIPDEIKFMDIRLLFLITALCPEVRRKVDDMIEPLITLLEETLQNAAENHIKHEELPPIFLMPVQADFSSEVMKALFNLTVRIEESDEEKLSICINLVKVLRSYLLISSTDLEKTWNLRKNVINLLTNMPDETYTELFPPVSEDHTILKSLVFEDKNMTAIYEILMFLKAKFNDEMIISDQNEILSPVVSVLLKGATNHRPVRKFLKIQILPPLTDVHSRPEQGTTLRNHLCRMLTTPITQLRDLVAELLFVLCKKNVARMIKYTGYGNAAGLFAQKGLLAGGGNVDEIESDSDSSETEEYADHKHGINPVIGCYEEPHASVTANMSEEQKEYEAMKLVELMDSLMKCGTIKPCVVGEDGKPEPIKHVLQLRDGLNNKKVTFVNEDSN